MKNVKIYAIAALGALLMIGCGRDAAKDGNKAPEVNQGDVASGKANQAQWYQKFFYTPGDGKDVKDAKGLLDKAGAVVAPVSTYLRNEENAPMEVGGFPTRVELFMTGDLTYVLKVTQIRDKHNKEADLTKPTRLVGTRRVISRHGTFAPEKDHPENLDLNPNVAVVSPIKDEEGKLTVQIKDELNVDGRSTVGLKDQKFVLSKGVYKSPEVDVKTMKEHDQSEEKPEVWFE